jgi:hypothetical protein
MSGVKVNNGVVNYGGMPSGGSGLFAQRPAAGVVGRIYIASDTLQLFRDTGSGWATIGGGGITGAGAAGQAAFWTGASAISGDNAFFWDNTNKRLGINTATPGVRLDIHGIGVIAQLNGTTTNNAFLDFQNAGTTQFRIGNNYNGGNRLFQIVDTVASGNIITINNNRQIGFNLPGTTFFASNWGYQLHSNIPGSSWDFSMIVNNATNPTVNQVVYATRNATYGSYGATQNGDQLYQLFVWGSDNSAYRQGGTIIYTQNGATGAFTPLNIDIKVNSASVNAANEISIKNTGFAVTKGRWNVNNATDNALFELNNNGNFYTGGLSPTILTVSVNTTMARTATGYYCTASLTLTLPSAASLNNIYWIIAASGVTVTVNRAGTDDILNLAGASVTTISVTSNQRAMFYVGGGTRTFLISQA